MIGPRPSRREPGSGTSIRGGRAEPANKHVAVANGRDSRSTTSRSRSRSRKNSASGRGKKAAKQKKDKEFAWMESEDESDKASSASTSPSQVRPVSIDKVETLSQMARLAPSLEKRLKRGDVRARELCEVAGALSRSKYFDAGLFECLASELRRVFKRKQLSVVDTLNAMCWLADLNAYDAAMFEAGCGVLVGELSGLQEADRKRLEAALKQVNHNPGEDFTRALRKSARADKREACPMFWRGQCKWGPKCKLSHDAANFEDSVQEGRWKPPSHSGGKSRGYMQSSDLYKEDKCGALW